MAKFVDVGHEETEGVLGTIEDEIAKAYKQAEDEVEDKLNEYLAKFEKKDALKQQAVLNGQISEEEYKQWRVGQIAVGERWSEMRDTLAEDYANTAEIAKSISYEHMPEVYAINFNYGTFNAETISGINTSFTLYNSDSVEYLFKDGEFYLPAGKKVTNAIKMGKQVAWDKKQIQSVMVQSLLQGESIGKIATRLSNKVGESDRKAAIRNARTMTTCVQNAGRLSSYERASNMGIHIRKQWLATLDNRTRHEHRLLDGQVREIGEPFQVDGYELEYPADPNASVASKLKMDKAANVVKGPAHLIYNCRCTIMGVLAGREMDVSDLSQRNTKHMDEDTYSEWKSQHESESHSITKQDEIEDTMKKVYGNEYKSYSNKMGAAIPNDWSKTKSINVSKSEKNSIKDYGKSKGINVQNINDFDGDSELIKSQIDTVSRWADEMPIHKGFSLNVSKDLKDADFGESYGRTIVINNKALRNRTITEENINRVVNEYASTTVEDIAVHEYGHIYANSYNISGQNAIDIAKQAYYNVINKDSTRKISDISEKETMSYLLNNVSIYSTTKKNKKRLDSDETDSGKIVKGSEIISEVFAKHNNNSTEFTTEYLRLLKERTKK